MHFIVIYGSVRRARVGIRGARFIEQQLKKRGHDTTLIDPQEYKLPLLDNMYKEYEAGSAPEPLEKLANLFARRMDLSSSAVSIITAHRLH